MASRGRAGAEPLPRVWGEGQEGGEWLRGPELCDARRARAPLREGNGGGEETIKREAGRAPRQKERSSGPAGSGHTAGTLGRAPGCVEK